VAQSQLPGVEIPSYLDLILLPNRGVILFPNGKPDARLGQYTARDKPEHCL